MSGRPEPAVPEAHPFLFGAALGLFVDPKYVRICGGGALVADPPTTDTCLPHTPAPSGYAARAEWAERKSRTHVQRRCPGCDLFKIWKPKEKHVMTETTETEADHG